MREIKFRGFNRKNNVWLHGFYLQNRGAHFVCPDEFAIGKTWEDYEIDPETLGQFTGMQDKNGKEVYEGDIIHLPDTEYLNGEMHGVVKYEDNCFVFESVNSKTKSDLAWVLRRRMYGSEPQSEVVGNVYDNPELLGNGTRAEAAQ